MREIVIEHPRMIEVHAKFEALIEQARHCPGGEKSCMPMIAPSGSGKTVIVRRFVEQKNTKEALSEMRVPVLHVTLKAFATRKSFAQDILIAIREFGFETGPDIGTENILQERVLVCLRAIKNELLIVDEFQHLASSRNEHVIYAVARDNQVDADQRRLPDCHVRHERCLEAIPGKSATRPPGDPKRRSVAAVRQLRSRQGHFR